MFQNEEVLRGVTIPNVVMNMQTCQSLWPPSCRFFHGDWGGLANTISSTTKYFYYYRNNNILVGKYTFVVPP